MKKYHLEILGNDTIYAMLLDQNGEYYNQYREDSYVCSEDGLIRTIKSERANCMWILVNVGEIDERD
jgi:hypothetical protein